ncbi:MAG TPA: pyrroline-5-carboxylate reductase [Anaerolineales bacterium]|nr:pyrroline-5-carboxylate reductase [Anaerolineales bacterium]
MLEKKIAFIGPGVMAEAMIAGLLGQKLSKPQNITAAGPRAERGQELHDKYGIRCTADNGAAASSADVVVLSVKPQRLSEVMKGLRNIPAGALVLSIVAGASIQKIGAGLKHKAIVRSMPNTPGQIGEGITVWTASAEVSPEQRRMAEQILGAMGAQVFVEDEGYLDMATALSGTGPAYVFLFTEALIDAGVHMGFPRRIAEQLVLQTIKGSADFYEQAERHPAALRNQVTSPGGTSAEALYYLEKAGFRTAISRAVWAAYQRSVELGKEKPGHLHEQKDSDEEQ